VLFAQYYHRKEEDAKRSRLIYGHWRRTSERCWCWPKQLWRATPSCSDCH